MKIIFITLLIFYSTFSKCQYIVEEILYSPPDSFYVGTPVIIGIDDRWSDTITLPFPFTYFNEIYDDIVIGSNGVVSFDLSGATGYCPWNLTSGNSIPNIEYPKNCIMGPYQDIDPTFYGKISYHSIGNIPFRKLMISFDSIPYYGDPNSASTSACGQAYWASSMIVLYENTGVIDIYIRSKEVCTEWNNGFAIEGIQNKDASIAFAVPGRNNGVVWTADSDAWRFTPDTSYHSGILSNNFQACNIFADPSGKLIVKNIPNNSLSVKIYDFQGRFIKSYRINQTEEVIDVSWLTQGIYFATIENNLSREVLRFVKE